MSFEDLPPDWPARPLNDPGMAADVLDLCVSNADRVGGGLAILVLREDLTLAQPVFVAGHLPVTEASSLVSQVLSQSSTAELPTAFVLGIAHAGVELTDADRALHQILIESCADVGAELLSTHLVTDSQVRLLPGYPLAA